MTRRLDGHRGITAGAILCLFALAVVSPALVVAPPARAEFREVSIVDDEFEPPEIIIQQGDTVVWVHRGVRPHGVRSTDGSFDSNPGCSFQSGESCMRNGDRYSRTFDQAGTFAYYCPVHGSANGIGMTGQVTVASGGGGGGTTTTSPPPPTTTTDQTGTTAQPPTTAASTTQSPGASTTAPSPGAPTTTVSGIPQDTAPVDGTPATDNPVRTTLTLTSPGDISDNDDDDGNLLILVAAVIVLAAAVSATAWYYRPGARPPGGPPPPVTPL